MGVYGLRSWILLGVLLCRACTPVPFETQSVLIGLHPVCYRFTPKPAEAEDQVSTGCINPIKPQGLGFRVYGVRGLRRTGPYQP